MTNNKITVYNRNTNITVKRNLFRLPILNIRYMISYTKDIKTKTTCIIDWYDPIYNIVRTTRASTIKHSNDKPNDIFAKRLAESRCKTAIYYKYGKEVRNILNNIMDKYDKLIWTETYNQVNLINNL